MGIIPKLVLVIVLIVINAFFVASEIVLISIRKTRIDELVSGKNPLAGMMKQAHSNLGTYIGATQLGVTITSLALGWLGESFISQNINDLLFFMQKSPFYWLVHALSVVIIFIFITFVQIVLGELVPKNIALRKTDLVSFIIITPLSFFAKIFKPFISILMKASNFILKLIGMREGENNDIIYTEKELEMILNQFTKSGLLPKNEIEVVMNALKLKDIPIKQLVMPRPDIVAFEVSTKLNDALSRIQKNLHSRYPVYKKTIDNIIGFVHVKDIYRSEFQKMRNAKLSHSKILRKIICIPETKKAYEVLLEMRKKHVHMAVVNDEFGVTVGIVTLEDIIESLVGDIQDEFDESIKTISRQPDGSYIIDGRTPIEAFRKKYNLELSGIEYTTVGGFVFDILGHEPHIGDKVKIGNMTAEIILVKGRRIQLIRLTRIINKELSI
jgi:CBS domain containing-hemolysin-like protein